MHRGVIEKEYLWREEQKKTHNILLMFINHNIFFFQKTIYFSKLIRENN